MRSALSSARKVAGAGVSPLPLRLIARLLLALVALLTGLGAALAQAQDSVASPGVVTILDTAARTIVNPWWTIGLLAFGCFCLFYEMLTPKTWGVSGNTGAVCVGVVFLANIVVKEAGWMGVLLLLAGLTLILLEVHVYPGFGAALAGFGVMFAGMFVALDGMHHAAFALGVTSGLTFIAGIAFLSYLPKSPAWKRMGRKIQEHQALNAAHFESNVLTADEMNYIGTSLFIGQRGMTTSPLRPIGTAEFNGVSRRVVTEGDFLEPGVRVVVTRVEGERIVVDPVAPPPAEPTGTPSTESTESTESLAARG